MEEETNLKEVWRLQEIDAAIQNLEQSKEKLPLELLPFRQALEETQRVLAEGKKTFETIQIGRKGKEGEIAANEEITKKLNIQLYSLKSNKEYTTMLKEIENLKNKNKELEDKVLELMEDGERYLAALKEREKEVKEQEMVFKKEQERINKETVKINFQLDSQRENRENQKNKVEGSLYEKYERIRLGKNGLGIAAVVSGCCGGCHISLPPQMVNEVKMRKVVFCGSCARLLYWTGENSK